MITRLYAGFSIPDKPITKKHVPKSERNMQLILRYSTGEGLSDLAREFRLSPQRVFWSVPCQVESRKRGMLTLEMLGTKIAERRM